MGPPKTSLFLLFRFVFSCYSEATCNQQPQKEVFTLVWNCFIGGKLRHNSQTCCQLEGSWWGDEDNDGVKGHCDGTSGFWSRRIPINSKYNICHKMQNKLRRLWLTGIKQTGIFSSNIYYLSLLLDDFFKAHWMCSLHQVQNILRGVMKWNSTRNKVRDHSEITAEPNLYSQQAFYQICWRKAKYIWKKTVADTLDRG